MVGGTRDRALWEAILPFKSMRKCIGGLRLVFEDEEGYGTMELLSAKANEED